MHKKYTNKLFCFSPPVMLATFLIEFSLAAYTFTKYKLTTITKLAIAILISLGVFQLAEYMICGGLGLANVDWARTGYIAITLLPALGIHLLTAISGKKCPKLVRAAYASCALFVAFYIIDTGSVASKACFSNYAVFYTSSISSNLFGLYYYGWLIVGVALANAWSKQMPSKRKSLIGMMIGYLAFILPTTTFNILDPKTIAGIPSIMCGFAVLLAIVISFQVLPSIKSIQKNQADKNSKYSIAEP